MHREAHYWYSHRLGREMGVVVFGHFGPAHDRLSDDRRRRVGVPAPGRDRRMAGAIDAGRVKVFCVNTNNSDSFGNEPAHPRHRSWMQAQYRSDTSSTR